MKKIPFTIVVFCLSAAIFGETTTPQIAYRFLDDFVSHKAIEAENGRRIGASVTMGLGITFLAASAGLYFWGDDFFNAVSSDGGAFWTPETRDITCFSVAGGGFVMTITGALILGIPAVDYKGKYAYVYEEEDPIVQEALAAAALYDLAEKGKEARIASGITNIAAPFASMLAALCVNLVRERPWYADMDRSFYSLSWNLVSGFSQLFWEKSAEERLYEKYLHARQVLLVPAN